MRTSSALSTISYVYTNGNHGGDRIDEITLLCVYILWTGYSKGIGKYSRSISSNKETLDVYESVKYTTIQTDRSRERREWKQLKCSEINGIWEATGSRRRSLIDNNREK